MGIILQAMMLNPDRFRESRTEDIVNSGVVRNHGCNIGFTKSGRVGADNRERYQVSDCPESTQDCICWTKSCCWLGWKIISDIIKENYHRKEEEAAYKYPYAAYSKASRSYEGKLSLSILLNMLRKARRLAVSLNLNQYQCCQAIIAADHNNP
nr:hypothetical protein CFP56_41294 [Quercus suber]